VIQEGANNLLNVIDFVGREAWRGIWFPCKLYLLTILDWGDDVWLVLWRERERVLETSECFRDVAWHRQINSFVFVVPVEVDATIELTFPVNVDFVMLFESLFEVLAMVKADGLDAKVVYH
jgi:hypothetical protein